MTELPQAEILNGEASEAEAMFLMLAGVAEPQRTILGTAAVRFAGGVVLSMAHDPVNYWSKALGFGVESPIDNDLVQRIIDTFAESGVDSATIQIAPQLLPMEWTEICAAHGIEAEGQWIKLAGAPDSVGSDRSDLRVGRVAPADIPDWSNVIFAGFGMPTDHLPALLVGAAESTQMQPFAVWDGDTMVAGASLVTHGDIGHLAGAATLPAFRGRGAQSALIAARIRAARYSGIRRLYAETGKPEQPGSNSSLNNMIRAGLQPLYERTNWRWTAPGS